MVFCVPHPKHFRRRETNVKSKYSERTGKTKEISLTVPLCSLQERLLNMANYIAFVCRAALFVSKN
jgi:hypothetical protein